MSKSHLNICFLSYNSGEKKERGILHMWENVPKMYEYMFNYPHKSRWDRDIGSVTVFGGTWGQIEWCHSQPTSDYSVICQGECWEFLSLSLCPSLCLGLITALNCLRGQASRNRDHDRPLQQKKERKWLTGLGIRWKLASSLFAIRPTSNNHIIAEAMYGSRSEQNQRETIIILITIETPIYLWS